MMTKFGVRIAVLGGVAVAVLLAGAGRGAHARSLSDHAAKTWDVQMSNDGGNHFDPKDLTIQVGDTVKWTIASGSHNVQFWKDSVPAGAVAILQKATQSDTLWTPRMPTAGQSFSIVFADAPKGVYKFFCTPHLMRGMVGSITVQ